MTNQSQPQIKKLTYTKILLLLTVFLTPLLGAYKGLGYEHTKVLFFILSISLIAFIWMFKKPQFKWTAISKASGVFILVLLLTSLTGIDPKISILGTQPYFQGLILYAYLFLFFLLVSASKIKFEHWVYVLVGSATIIGLLAIGEWIQINLLSYQLPTYAGRVVSSFGQPNFYSGFLLLTLPFFNFLLKQKQKGFLVLLGFLITILAIILSESKAAFLVLGALFILWLILELRNNKLIILTITLVAISLAVFSSFYFTSGLFFKQIIQPLNVTDLDLIHLTNVSVEQRASVQQARTITQFRYAEDPVELSKASWQNYVPNIAVSHTFKDTSPGPKFIFVQFADANNQIIPINGQSYITSSAITLSEPTPTSTTAPNVPAANVPKPLSNDGPNCPISDPSNYDIGTLYTMCSVNQLARFDLKYLVDFPNEILIDIGRRKGDLGGFLANFSGERLLGLPPYSGSGFSLEILKELPDRRKQELPGYIQDQLK